MAAGLEGKRTLIHGKEFQADKFAAELMGDAGPMSRVMEMLAKRRGQNHELLLKQMEKSGIDAQKIAEYEKEFAKKAKQAGKTHPSHDQRIAYLGKMFPETAEQVVKG